MAQLLQLDSTTIKTPIEFSIEKYRLTKAGRVASGLMMIDSIARKRKFIMVWDVISGTELDILLNIIDNDSDVFFTLSYVENGTTKTAECYSGAISAKQFRTDGVWYWEDVSVNLIER